MLRIILHQKFLSNFAIRLIILLVTYGKFCQGFRSFRETHSTKLNVSEYPGELCNRECDNEPRLCYFHFNLEHYQAMGVACGKCAEGVEEDCLHPQCVVADGIEKGIMTVNRQIPGPPIHVCKDDLVVVDVSNSAHGTAAAIHWHGLHMIETPFMDGVPFLTQCPIPFSTTFRYHFFATQPGTHFYHSHAGHQKANGQYGALIVRKPKKSFHYLKYDFDLPEHYMLLNDWMHRYAEHHFPGIPGSTTVPDSILINSRGQYYDPEKKKHPQVTPTIYYVAPGKRYRFRLINSGNHVCPYEMQIEDHDLTIIATDSYDVIPYATESLVSNSGERYDFIVNANHTHGDYIIRVKGMGICSAKELVSFAVLRYRVSWWLGNHAQPVKLPKYDKHTLTKSYLNHPNSTCDGAGLKHCAIEMMAIEEDEQLKRAKPDYKFYLAFQNHVVPNQEVFAKNRYNHFVNTGGNDTVIGSINKLSLVFPHFPLLTQPDLIDESIFCNMKSVPKKCAGRTVCPCLHRLKVPLNSIVELIIVDETKGEFLISHPFHLHGYRFMLTGMGKDALGKPMNVGKARLMDSKKMLPRFTAHNRLLFKDTISVPNQGYAIVRFKATNPGFWLMHCHYDWHFSNGMGLVLQVGEPSEMVRAPKGFPQCSSYLPPVVKDEYEPHLQNPILSKYKSLRLF